MSLILVGFPFGHVFLYLVFKCRCRGGFRRHQGDGWQSGASFFLLVVSALIFMHGMQVEGWAKSPHHRQFFTNASKLTGGLSQPRLDLGDPRQALGLAWMFLAWSPRPGLDSEHEFG